MKKPPQSMKLASLERDGDHMEAAMTLGDKTAKVRIPIEKDLDLKCYRIGRALVSARLMLGLSIRLSDDDIETGREILKCA